MNKNKVYTAPDKTEKDEGYVKIFLAGSIDSGDTEDWQKKVCDKILKTKDTKVPFAIYNPRRSNWLDDDEHKEIYRQIEWELDHMDKADIIIMNILGDSKSPISLMEIGIHCHDGKLMVYCPKNFYRFDNVNAVCKRFNIPLFTDVKIEDTIEELLKKYSK